MPQNPNLRKPTGSMSVGNVVSAALVLYRSHLKTYLRLASTAYLWILVPVYGWGKYLAISATICRLAFQELIGQPETIRDARRYTKPRLWSFFLVAFLVGLMLSGVTFLLYIGLALVLAIFGFGLGFVLNSLFNSQVLAIIVAVITSIIGLLGLLFGFTWFFSRFMIAEVPLAVEQNTDGTQSISRSWQLTKNSVFRIQGVVIVAFLVTIPLVVITTYIPLIVLMVIGPESDLYGIFYFFYLICSFGGGILILPFWQTIKGVLYYDLRSRREGLGLDLGDSASQF